MEEKKYTKTARQLKMYALLRANLINCPDDFKKELGITNRRMWERDLNDLRDSGLCDAKLVKTCDSYGNRRTYYSLKKASFDENAENRRYAHLIRLRRLGILLMNLGTTDYYDDYIPYRNALNTYKKLLEKAKNNPSVSKENLKFAKEELEFCSDFPKYDLKEQYKELFPECNERTRQRDFEEINRAGIPLDEAMMRECPIDFQIIYDRNLKRLLFVVDTTILREW